MKLYEKITAVKGHMSYSTWMKEAAEFYINNKSMAVSYEEPRINNEFEDFLDGF